MLASELLTESRSVFVQISDETVLVRLDLGGPPHANLEVVSVPLP